MTKERLWDILAPTIGLVLMVGGAIVAFATVAIIG